MEIKNEKQIKELVKDIYLMTQMETSSEDGSHITDEDLLYLISNEVDCLAGLLGVELE